jgi:hypothetical protein
MKLKKGDRIAWIDHAGHAQTGTVIRTHKSGPLRGTVFAQIDGRPEGQYGNIRVKSAEKEISHESE